MIGFSTGLVTMLSRNAVKASLCFVASSIAFIFSLTLLLRSDLTVTTVGMSGAGSSLQRSRRLDVSRLSDLRDRVIEWEVCFDPLLLRESIVELVDRPPLIDGMEARLDLLDLELTDFSSLPPWLTIRKRSYLPLYPTTWARSSCLPRASASVKNAVHASSISSWFSVTVVMLPFSRHVARRLNSIRRLPIGQI
jgi:hypothetical protein